MGASPNKVISGPYTLSRVESPRTNRLFSQSICSTRARLAGKCFLAYGKSTLVCQLLSSGQEGLTKDYQKITLQDIFSSHCLTRSANILKDPSHPGHHMFALLPSGKHLMSIKSRTNRFKNSFHPTAIRSLNTSSHPHKLRD